MNWLSLDEERDGWKFFWHSILLPIYFWLFIICLLFLMAYMPNKYIFENILSFIPYIISFRLGIIATFGALILTLYINVHTETKEWSTPQEYKYSFAYQKYAKLISYFLGIVWFMNFLYVAWRDANIPEGIKRIFLAGIWENDNHGKFMGADVAVDSGIPLWVFLFLSWFVLSISVYMSNNKVSIHHTIMAACKEVSVIYKNNNGILGRYSKKTIKLITEKYDGSSQNSNMSKLDESNNLWKEVYKIFPNTSVKGYHYLINGIGPLKRKLFIKMFIIYEIIVLVHSLFTINLLENTYHISLNFGMTRIIFMIVFSIIFYILIILLWVNLYLDNVNILMVHSKAFWTWVMSVFSCIFILIMMMLVFLLNLITILYAYQSGGEGYDGNDMFQTLLKPIIASVILLLVSYVALIWNQIDYITEYHKRVILKVVFGMDSESVNQNLYININTFMVSRVIYLRAKAKSIYSKYLRSYGGDESSLNSDLCKAYKIAMKDSTKFPSLINVIDIFS